MIICDQCGRVTPHCFHYKVEKVDPKTGQVSEYDACLTCRNRLRDKLRVIEPPEPTTMPDLIAEEVEG